MIAPTPFDVWDIGHMLVGSTMGILQLKRWFAYPLKVVWELYQLFVYYQPQGLGIGDIWVNSVLDTLVFAFIYEITLPIARYFTRRGWWRRLSVRTKGVAAYLLLLYGGSFVMGWDLKPSPAPDAPQLFAVIFPMALCPAISAFIVRGWVTREGFAEAGFTLNFRRKWLYYAAGGILPAVIAVTAWKLGMPGPALPSWLQMSITGTGVLQDWLAPMVQLLVLTVIMAAVLFGQEFGWRGYFQPRLNENRMIAAVIGGLVWGLWLFLVTWRAYRLHGEELLDLMFIPVVAVCLSIILEWFRSRTGSIWAASLLHGGIAAAGSTFIYAPVYVNPELVYLSSLGIWSLIPVGALCAWIVADGLRRHNLGEL